MARILNRPMFRKGGSTNEGIMHGLVDRRGYGNGSFDEKRLETDVSAITAAMNKYAPLPRSKFPMGQIGLNLVSGQYAGEGLLPNVARSAMGPYAGWTEADDARNAAIAQRKGAAVSTAVGSQLSERLARAKASGTSTMQKDYSTDRKYFELVKTYTEAPKDRYSKTITNIYPHGMAEFGSRIQDNAFKTEEGAAFMQEMNGVVPHQIIGGVAEWDYSKMDAGAYYYHPGIKSFVQRQPRTEDTPAQIIIINPYTFKEVRRQNLE